MFIDFEKKFDSLNKVDLSSCLQIDPQDDQSFLLLLFFLLHQVELSPVYNHQLSHLKRNSTDDGVPLNSDFIRVGTWPTSQKKKK